MIITCKGRARHHFWGGYSATIALGFKSPKEAELALPLLKVDGWRLGKTGKGLVIHAENGTIDRVLDELASFGADREKILSVNKSIDLGEWFSCTFKVEDFKVEDPRQERLCF